MTAALTLSDLQTEREWLRALAAQGEHDALLADTVAHRAVLAVGARLRSVVDAALTRLPALLARAIDGERDETRVHYLLSDAAHTFLTTLGAEAAQAVDAATLTEHFVRGVRPRDLLSVSQWADRHRWLRSGTNAPGRWNTELTPYLREIMDALSEHSPVRTVVFKKSSGVGGSEVMMNWIGYVMHHLRNKDLLVIMPTLELRDRSLNPRMNKMIGETEALAGLVSTSRRDKSNRADVVEYGAHARIIRSGANSADSLRSDHIPYVIADEVSAFPWDIGGEGDPMTLIENRQRTYSRAKSYFVSTPTVVGQCRISQLYARSDQRHYLVPCPHCGQRQSLKFDRSGKDGEGKPHGLKWRTTPTVDGDTGEVLRPQVLSAWYVCEHCGGEIAEAHKPDMLAQGVWVAQKPDVKRLRGYHLNALYAPVGLGLGWRDIAQKWLDCQGDTAEMKAFVNTYLGQTWEEQGDSIEAVALLSRLENYDPATAPPAAPWRLITAGVDVQKNRLEASIVGWGEKEEAWLLDHLILPGDTAESSVWQDLAHALREARVQLAVVDSGYNASAVYAFCAAHRWAIPGKGMAGTARPLIEDERRRAARLRRRAHRQHVVEPIGVDQAKALIYARLKLEPRKEGNTPDGQPCAGFIHFPRTPAFDDEYFAQLAAEKLVTRLRGSRPFSEWVQTRARNESLDCFCYALAAMRLSRVNLSNPLAQPAAQTAPIHRPPRRRIVSGV